MRVYQLRPETVADLPAPNLPLALVKARQQEVQEAGRLDAQLELFQAPSEADAQSADGGSGAGQTL